MRVRRSQHLERYRIRGGNRLHGEVEISGAKNAAVAIIPAALMVNGKCRIENLPQISDTEALLLILESLGAKVEQIDRSTVEIDATNATWMGADYDRMRKIRASYYFVGSMLGRFGIARTTMPGGCNFGVRPIDQHVKGMNALGAEVDISDFITAHVPGGRLRGASVYLDKVSVGATMNIMIAAVLAEGRTIIENAAREPHIVDLANFLNSMGADVRGAGTDTIKVNGVEQLHGGCAVIQQNVNQNLCEECEQNSQQHATQHIRGIMCTQIQSGKCDERGEKQCRNSNPKRKHAEENGCNSKRTGCVPRGK